MRLYLMQHAEAVAKEVDSQRPLSEEGRRQARLMADFLSSRDFHPARIVHSGKARAKQTAEIVASIAASGTAPKSSSHVSPDSPPETVASEVEDSADDTLLVGHLPHLSRLASLLLAGNADAEVVTFKYACVVCLERNSGYRWHIRWAVTPDLIA